MQLRMSLQRSNHNILKNKNCKNKTKIALPAQYYTSCPNNPEVLYILVSIKLHIIKNMELDRDTTRRSSDLSVSS